MAVVRALSIRATGRVLAPMAAVLAIVGLDRIAALRNWPIPVVGLLDEPAHLLTAWVVLAAVGVTPSRVVRWVLLGAVVIDVDHIPLYLWGVPVTGDGGRPVTHSLTTVAALLLVAAAVPRSRTVVSALTAGLVLHMARDIVTGPGIPLLWPIRPDSVLLPYPACLALLTAAACWAASGERGMRCVQHKGSRPLDCPASVGYNSSCRRTAALAVSDPPPNNDVADILG